MLVNCEIERENGRINRWTGVQFHAFDTILLDFSN